MANYTSLNQDEIKSISSRFNLHKIDSFTVLVGGLENSNYKITSNEKSYVLSICEQKSFEKAEELALLLEYLNQNNFHTSKTINNKQGNPILVWNKKPIMIKKYIQGKIEKNFSENILKLIGEQIAKLHMIPPPSYLPSQVNYGKEKFDDLKKYSDSSKFQLWLNQKIEYLKPFFKIDLTKSFIHSDVFYDNIIVSNDELSITIMDFEESAFYYRIYDIGMAIIGVCRDDQLINLDKVKNLMIGYKNIIDLSENELKSLKAFTVYAGVSMTFWRYLNFNYIKPNSLLSNHYLELKNLTDFIEKLPDNAFDNL